MTHDETTKHGANIIDMLMNYSVDNNISTYDLLRIFVEVMKLMKKVCEENIKKFDS